MKNTKIVLKRLYKKLTEDMANSKEREKIAAINKDYEKEHTEQVFQIGIQLPMRYIQAEAKAIVREEEAIKTKKLIKEQEKIKELEK